MSTFHFKKVTKDISHGHFFFLRYNGGYLWLFFTVKSATVEPATQFQCRDYRIPIELKCDGLTQCIPDGSDELDCPTIHLKNTTILSKNQSKQVTKTISG